MNRDGFEPNDPAGQGYRPCSITISFEDERGTIAYLDDRPRIVGVGRESNDALRDLADKLGAEFLMQMSTGVWMREAR